MTRSFTEINAAIARQLVESIGIDRFEMWFGTSDAIRADADGVAISADDELSLSFLRQQFDSTVRSAVVLAFGQDRPIRYLVNAPAEAAVRQGCLFSDDELESAITSPAASSGDARAADSAGEKRTARNKTPRRRNATSGAATGKTLFDTRQPDTLPASRPDQLLQSFRFGSSNDLLRAAIDEVLARPGKFSPLVLIGPSGSGKSHLANGLVAESRRRGICRRSLAMTAEQFTTGFLEGLHGKGLPLFRNKYRQLDLLVIDDIQFLAGKKATIIEFQNTLETLMRGGKQLVVTANRPLAELEFLGDSLVTRLSGGMVCPIAWPDIEARQEIARSHAVRIGANISPETTDMICHRVGRDVRMLFGAINRLHAATAAMGKSVEPESATRLLSDLLHSQAPVLSIEKIERVVCEVCGVSPDEMKGEKRVKRISTARMLAIWLARQHTTAGLSEIGAYFGGRNHSTVIAARNKIDLLQKNDAEIDVSCRRMKVSAALQRIQAELRVG